MAYFPPWLYMYQNKGSDLKIVDGLHLYSAFHISASQNSLIQTQVHTMVVAATMQSTTCSSHLNSHTRSNLLFKSEGVINTSMQMIGLVVDSPAA